MSGWRSPACALAMSVFLRWAGSRQASGLAPPWPASGLGSRVRWLLDAVVMVWLSCSAVVAASLLSSDAGN
jgi:hypothetical protein